MAFDDATRSPTSSALELGAREKAAIGKIPGIAWRAAIDGRGDVRERRADGACADRRCASCAPPAASSSADEAEPGKIRPLNTTRARADGSHQPR